MEDVFPQRIDRTGLIVLMVKIAVYSMTTFLTIQVLKKSLDPTNNKKQDLARKAKEVMAKLGIKTNVSLTEHELMIASHLMNPSDISISWSSIGGLKSAIEEIKMTVILPLTKKHLFQNSQLTQPPKGILLHGPPGCGKTMLAKATAKEAGCRFINLDLSLLTDKWYGESQKLAAAVFSLAVKIQPCIIFIDEIDSFLRSRNLHDHEATAMMKTQFMTLWDGLSTDSSATVIVMGATNRPRDLDKAILRRMPTMINIPLPDESQRKEILSQTLKNEACDNSISANSLADLARLTNDFSGSDLFELCRNASMYRVKDFMLIYESDGGINDKLRPISFNDLKRSLQKMVSMKVKSQDSLDD